MNYYRADLKNKITLFASEDGDMTALRLGGDEARIIYTDRDPIAFGLAEKKAKDSGKEKVICEYASKYWEYKLFLEERGYSFLDTMPVLTANLWELFDSKGVKKSIEIDFPGTEYIPLRNLMLYQMEEIAELFKTASIPLTKDDLVRFDDDLSGIVYDQNLKIVSVILSSVQGNEIVIECLYGTKKDDPRYIMAALQGFAKEIIDCDILEVYENVAVLEVNSTVGALIKRLLDGRYEVKSPAVVVRAEKKFNDSAYDDLPEVIVSDRLKTFELKKMLEEKLEYRSYQNNINWKTDWSI